TRWTMFCLAACAAMRPNMLESNLQSSSSPSSASGSRVSLSSGNVISVAWSCTVSTTVLASKSSTSPISGLNCASILRWWPKVFFAAEIIAFSKALIRIVLSMPFSLLTCSMTRFRSCCISGTPIVLVVGLLDQRKGNIAPCPILVQRDLVGCNLEQLAQKRPSAIDQLTGANANFFADESREMLRPFKRTIDAGGGNLQRVGAVDDVVHVEQVADFAAYPAQIIHCRTALLIEIQPQYPAAAAALVPKFDIDDLDPFRLCHRRDQFPYARDGRIHPFGPQKQKKRA